MELKNEIVKRLSDLGNQEKVEQFASYCVRIKSEKNKDGSLKNPFMQYKKVEELAGLYRRVLDTGLFFDGVHITLQSTGISYDYVAYKNKMLLAYPESKIDVATVSKEDEFAFERNDGKVIYSHKIKNPFGNDEIAGAYCVVKNNRGEFLTLLSREELDKHRKVAKTDFIWKAWYKEMVLKTVIKKACKLHFDDVYEKIENIDNENYDLENLLDVDIKTKQDIENINTQEELISYYQKHKGKVKGLNALITKRKNEIA